ncbi:FecR family protein [Lacibacter sp. MH-610]|uniref:FecR family protein n=1 Tax=Lacibacter sp. MH-610 TaxID=3020883 RepID=UPI0038916C75
MTKDKIWHLVARKLNGEASPEELKELELLQQEGSLLHYELQLLEQFWHTEPEADTDYLEATYLLHHSKMKKLGIEPGAAISVTEEAGLHPSTRFSGRKLLVFSLLALLVITTAYFVVRQPARKTDLVQVPEKKAATQGVVETKKASKTKLVLPDGSTVWLNSGSKLSYQNMMSKADKREVTLTGEAYFDVTRNPKRPFIIHTSSIDVKVLGTEFNVKAYPDDATVETSLIHGSVQVYLKNDPSKSYLLKPNEKLILYKPGDVVNTTKRSSSDLKSFGSIPKVAVEKLNYINGSPVATEAAWVKNQLSFNDESFKDIAVKLERWYDVEFEFKNNQLELERLTGSLPSASLKQALDAWKFTTPGFNYRIEDKKVIIY